eukprot:Skav203466  [mRNA]  locus=scaffold3193:32958:34644:+ [translate_table: standard]
MEEERAAIRAVLHFGAKTDTSDDNAPGTAAGGANESPREPLNRRRALWVWCDSPVLACWATSSASSSAVKRTTPEPSWHRALRNRRRALRSQLRFKPGVLLGCKRKKRIRAVVRELTHHHSWNPFQVPLWIRQQMEMTWWCSQCQCTNNSESQYCEQCEQHWSVTWRKRRSRSKHGKDKDKQKNKDKEKVKSKDLAPAAATQAGTTSDPKEDLMTLIPDKVPWIVGTPQARLANKELQRIVHLPAQDDLPPPPTLPEPPSASTAAPALTQEEQQALNHLRGLAGLGMDLPDALKEQLQHLLAKEKESQSGKSLNHTHLYRLNRLRTQVTNAQQRIQGLDREWQAFVSSVSAKLQLHGQCYQQCRADMMENYNKRLQELTKAKQEVTEASQLLLGQDHPVTMATAMPNIVGDLQQLHATMETAGMVDQVYMISEPEDMEDMEDESSLPHAEAIEGVTTKKTVSRHSTYRSDIKVAPFNRTQTSPTKVNQHMLKQNQGKEPRPRKEDKTNATEDAS